MLIVARVSPHSEPPSIRRCAPTGVVGLDRGAAKAT